jgi:predicted negative regulator of RcsB-dependent stress response
VIAVDDFLTERDQWDALKTWLKENGAWIVAGVLIGVIVLYGWRWWQERTTTRNQTAASRYSDVLDALARKDRARADQLVDTLSKDYADTPYVDQGQLALARADVESGSLDAAARRLAAIAADAEDDELRNVARLRLARVQLMRKKPDEALVTLAQVKAGAFTPAMEEVKGDALLAKGDKAGALAAYRRAVEAAEPGLMDQGLLQLKINDLAPAAEVAATTEPPKDSEK